MARLFVAVDLPDHLHESLAAICTGIASARWERPHLLHLTLRFIGEADAATTAALQTALLAIDVGRFQLEFAGVGTFPPIGRKPPRVLWVGVADNPALARLQQKVDAAATSCCVEPESRAWKPHLTLARFKRPPGSDLKAWLDTRKDFRLAPVQIREFHLFESKLLRSGAVHTKVQTLPLK
jgi:2'-5' RNA ligase